MIVLGGLVMFGLLILVVLKLGLGSIIGDLLIRYEYSPAGTSWKTTARKLLYTKKGGSGSAVIWIVLGASIAVAIVAVVMVVLGK